MRWIFFAAALLLASPLFGQTIGGLSTLPVLSEGRFPVSGFDVPQGSIDELSKWAQKLVVEASGPDGSEAAIEVDIGLVKRAPTIYFAGDKPGLYVICIVDTGSKTPKIATKRVQVGEVAPPSPNPPQPGPSPTPPVVSGKRVAIILHEASNQSPEMAQCITKLRNGPTAKWMEDRGHKLYIVDKTPVGLPEAWSTIVRKEAAQALWPRLIVIDPATNAVLFGDNFGSNPDTVVEIIKRTGGE